MHDFMFSAGNTHYSISGDRLRIVQDGDPVFGSCLSPVIDGISYPITSWQKRSSHRITSSLRGAGTVFFEVDHGQAAFWVETSVEPVQNVVYLSDGVISGKHWRTFVSDVHERLWEKNVDADIPVSSAYASIASPDGEVPGGMTDPDDSGIHWIWNVHVRAWAFEGAARWLGISIPWSSFIRTSQELLMS